MPVSNHIIWRRNVFLMVFLGRQMHNPPGNQLFPNRKLGKPSTQKWPEKRSQVIVSRRVAFRNPLKLQPQKAYQQKHGTWHMWSHQKPANKTKPLGFRFFLTFCWWLKSGKFTSWGTGALSHYFQSFWYIPLEWEFLLSTVALFNLGQKHGWRLVRLVFFNMCRSAPSHMQVEFSTCPSSPAINGELFWEVLGLHPGRLTWNLTITHLKRKIIFQTIIFRFHVNLPGCNKSWRYNEPFC